MFGTTAAGETSFFAAISLSINESNAMAAIRKNKDCTFSPVFALTSQYSAFIALAACTAFS